MLIDHRTYTVRAGAPIQFKDDVEHTEHPFGSRIRLLWRCWLGISKSAQKALNANRRNTNCAPDHGHTSRCWK